jgi:RNA-directed DNA polymerase
MTKASINLQDLRRRIYIKAKAEKAWRFWGLYTHMCKMETLEEAYKMAKKNNGAPGIDGMTFEDIELRGVEDFLRGIQQELKTEEYLPEQNRKKEIPKGGGKVRILGIPTIKDRVVQGAAKLILEPIFEADFQEGSYGYRPKRNAHEAIQRVAKAIVEGKTRVIDLDLSSYFDTVRHDILLKKVAERVDDNKVMRLLKLMLKASGKKGVPQGGVISTLMANIYLNEVDKMLEKAKEATRWGKYTYVEYARFADDIVILIDGFRKWRWLERGVNKRLREELMKLDLQINEDKTQSVDLMTGGKFSFLGFDFRRVRSRNGKWRPQYTPRIKARTKLLRKLKEIFRRFQSQPIGRSIELINPVLRGWVNYFRVGHSSRCFGYVKDWVEKKLRRHLMKTRKRKGFGWKRWSRDFLYQSLGLYGDYRIRHVGS